MQYQHIEKGIFLSRPNRFIADLEIGGQAVKAHVKNTGRCGELLIPGAVVYAENHREEMGKRKTAYSLISVKKEGRLINMDSQAPNEVALEGLSSGSLTLPGMTPPYPVLRREQRFGDSRFDFYAEDCEGKRAYIEVKGVTLEENGIVRFPDAPTLRGLKHVDELCRAADSGYLAYLIFVVQMEGVRHFEPNDFTQPDFGKALVRARQAGVQILAVDCRVTESEIEMGSPVAVCLTEGEKDGGQ